ncbi:MAG: hypothetical protein DRI39_04870 [Chloroflexi bacterium]|nr:MAG: hypothetical protein DRI39_04870 [Chloroflexota bacterium]
MAMFGYAGKILRVDLSSRKTESVSTLDYADQLIGGRGIAAKVYWDEVPPDAEATHADNRLIFATGPLAGVPVLGGSRWGVFGKSLHPVPGRFCYGNFGGRWGAELKFAGYDAIIVHGTSERPVYLFVYDGHADIRDASALWGKGSVETRETLKTELGSTVKVVAVGPAGENTVSTACLTAENDASASGGLGAVMGAKKLKAVAVSATQKALKVAQPDRLRDLTTRFRQLDRGAITAWGTDFRMTGPNIKKDPCYGCLGNCLRVLYTAENGKQGKYMCQSALFYQPWAYRYYGTANDVPFYANRLCDDYGLDTWSLELMLLWLNRCYRNGIVTEHDTGLPFSKLGSLEFIQTLVRMIATREGFGDVLARGMAEAAASLGTEAVSRLKHSDPYEPRLYVTTALLWAIAPREPIQELHEVGLLIAQWVSWLKKVEGAHVTSDVLRAIAQKFWGSKKAADFTTWEGKALAAKRIQDRQYAKECLILCDWIWPIMDNKYAADGVGDPTFESQIFSAVTGRDMDEEGLYTIGERVFNLQRAILLREGWRGRQDDRLPDEWHDSPLKTGITNPECLVPGKRGEAVSRKGAVVDREEFERAKEEYYRLRRWDVGSGLQTARCLHRLGLEDVAADLERRGLLAGTRGRGPDARRE